MANTGHSEHPGPGVLTLSEGRAQERCGRPVKSRIKICHGLYSTPQAILRRWFVDDWGAIYKPAGSARHCRRR